MRLIGVSGAVLAVAASAAIAVSPAAAHDRDDGCHGFGAAQADAHYARTVVHDGPTAYWRLGGWDGNRDVVGGSGGDLTAGQQVASYGGGAIGCGCEDALQLFGGTADDVWESHLLAGDGAPTSAPGTSHFGIEAWVRPDVLDGNARRIASRESAAGGYLLAARADALVFARYADDGGGAGTRWSTVAAPPLPLHQWSHVVADYDADGVMRVWVDGELAGQQASDLALPEDPAPGAPEAAVGGRFVLGASGRLWNPADPSTQAWLEWDGGIDEAAFYGPDATNLAPHEIRHHWRIGSHGDA